MVPLDKLAQITERFEYLEARLNAGAPPAEIAKISREYSDLKPVVDKIHAYRTALDDLADAEGWLSDPEMRSLAEEELPALKSRIPEMEQALRVALLPKAHGQGIAGVVFEGSWMARLSSAALSVGGAQPSTGWRLAAGMVDASLKTMRHAGVLCKEKTFLHLVLRRHDASADPAGSRRSEP
jgi:hypothetical protein